ncbi:MAG: (2Fe-2S)-binding protein [Sneathiella sp.]|jgi:phenylpropionate dioxygenase-like ring-hydroxylating dioxygenase large terminal subunit|uniref:aromatic ring-hydroxylating oxygenase subunit alpha n=1 Tax=Sneathiella sp. TaxID=1964365 RepID=UPI000C4AA46F|nr:aromatic ring-hydroxylating dioxygenase subunit alpha [Sneathiella sp.]MAL80750.1 (2Fe-2S)-binding protein [Sneathiella sp.]|tara:strand:- start:903 stop:2039 length:1137 start_codon:yes stop_codon:yes gene_type:complete
MTFTLNEADVIDRIFTHLDAKTTDMGDRVWREPVDNYLALERFNAEIELLRRVPVPFCPSAALPEKGSYIARTAAQTPIVVVRGEDGIVRAFRNSCRHRGMKVATGSGCARSFICPYHAWTYGLNGNLKHIPGREGFPDIDMAEHGLVPVTAEERGGIVFVTQETPVSNGTLDAMPEILSPRQDMFATDEYTDEANWKLIAETSMEGYHIKSLHKRSFYPYGLDNTNIVELFGPNSRIIFPFRRINKLRDIPREKRRMSGMTTDVFQFFPNTHLSVLSNHTQLVILEPISPSETLSIIYRLRNLDANGEPVDLEVAKRDAGFVKESGIEEDREAARAIQAGLSSKANSHFTFGHYEKGIVHFHEHLTAHLDMMKAPAA